MMNINKQQGASVLEFLIIIPTFLMFILLIGEVGIIFYTMNTLTKATQDTTRFLSEDKASYTTHQALAQNLLIYGSASNSGTPLLPSGNANTSSSITRTATHVSVVTTYQHNLILGSALGALTGLATNGSLGFGNTFQLSASSVMRFTR